MVMVTIRSMLIAAVAKAAAQPRSADELAAIVFLDIAIVVTVARLVGSLFKRIRQPAVVGEIMAGIALGPSLLGLFPGHLPTRIFPTDVRPYLSIFAQLGLIIFMFIVGLEVDVALIRGKERVAGLISLSSIALPFGLGILLASAIHTSHANAQAPQAHRFVPFALFIGASMSITAFPVLARILTERQMHRTEIGAVALACAAVDDVVAWSLLALVLAVIKSSNALSLPRILLEAVLFVAFMFLAVRPALAWLAAKYRRAGRLTPNIFATVLVGFLMSAYITERIGIHQIFGAFLFGVVMPRKDTAPFFQDIVERVKQVSLLLLLPLFFIVTGFSVDLRHLGADALTQLPLILLVAIVGKLLGATLAARAQGLPGRKAAAIGVLMNTRGLTELIILNVGLQFGVLDIRLFTMLVVMAVLTTIMTEPLLRLVYPRQMLQRDIEEAEKAARGSVDAFRVLAVIGGGDDDDFLVDTAADVIGDEAAAELVLTSFRQTGTGPEVGTGVAPELEPMATLLDHLKALSGRAQARAVRSVVRWQFSDDVATSLVAQAAAVEADLLLIPIPADDGAALTGSILSGATGEVVFVVDGGGGPIECSAAHPVAVVVSEGADGAAALELAARLSFSRRTPLRLIPATSAAKLVRLAAERAEELSAHLDARAVSRGDEPLTEAVAAASPCLVVGAVDQQVASEGLVLLVRAAADDDGRGLERWLWRSEADRRLP